MTDIRVFQAHALAAAEGDGGGLLVTQAFVTGAARAEMDINVVQAFVMVAVQSRPYDPTVRAWTFTLDGHDFYVLRLGEIETLVYDTHSEQWYVWGTGETDLWAVLDGTNWGGGHAFSGAYGSNVLAGSDTNGALFLLDPNGPDDSSAVFGDETLVPFVRQATAQYIMRGYDTRPCWGVQVMGSIGDVRGSEPTDVTLETSDDRGDSYDDCGTVTIAADDITARLDWRSLGSMTSPGRLFRITDYGALHRLDSLEMPD